VTINKQETGEHKMADNKLQVRGRVKKAHKQDKTQQPTGEQWQIVTEQAPDELKIK